MGNILDDLDRILTEDSGATSSYTRKVKSELTEIYSHLETLEENDLITLKKQIELKLERIEFLKEQEKQKNNMTKWDSSDREF